jgi:hypothetical protein
MPGRPNAPSLGLAKWEIRLYARYIGTVHERCFAQPAFALCSFRGQQMTPRRVRSQHLAARGDFKTLRYCFTCFASRNWLRHKVAKIIRREILTITFCPPSQAVAPISELNVGR